MATTVSRDSKSLMVYPTEYYLRELFDVQEQNLPLLVYIRDGYHGNSEVETIASGQFIYIRGISRQTRVIAKDKSGRFQNNLLSIPRTFPMSFQVSGKKNQKYTKRISDFIDEGKFPVHVEMCGSNDSKFIVGDRSAYPCNFKLILTDTFTERYFIANYLFEDTRRLDKHTIPLPLYLPNVKLSIAYGFETGSYDEWQTFMKSLEAEAENADGKIEQFGDEDIAILSAGPKPVSNPVYEYIEPNAYMSLVLTKYSTINEPSYDLLVKDIDKMNPVQEHKQEIQTSTVSDHKQVLQTQPDPEDKQTTQPVSDQKQNLQTQPVPENKRALQTQPVSEHKQKLQTQPISERSQTPETQPDSKHKQTMKAQTSPVQNKSTKTQPFREKGNSTATEKETMRQSSYDLLMKEFNSTKIKLNKNPKKTQSPPVPERPAGYKTVRGVSSVPKNDATVRAEPAQPEDVITLENTKTEYYSEPQPEGVITLENTKTEYYSEPQENLYEELPGDSACSYDGSRNISAYVNTTAANNDKPPIPVSMMTVDDVAGVLSRLSLAQYVQVFQEQMIDGPILLDLDKDILADFGFKKIEILRLMKYIKSGHVPIQNSDYSSV